MKIEYDQIKALARTAFREEIGKVRDVGIDQYLREYAGYTPAPTVEKVWPVSRDITMPFTHLQPLAALAMKCLEELTPPVDITDLRLQLENYKCGGGVAYVVHRESSGRNVVLGQIDWT